MKYENIIIFGGLVDQGGVLGCLCLIQLPCELFFQLYGH